jgi:LacI family transcriptional regulator
VTGTHGTQPTLRDVARVAGVHLATASRALSGSKSRPVNSRTEALVRQAADELGYVLEYIGRILFSV